MKTEEELRRTAYVELRSDLADRYRHIVGTKIPVMSTVPKLIFDDPERGIAKVYIVDIERFSPQARDWMLNSVAQRFELSVAEVETHELIIHMDQCEPPR